jgi:hypothetical protein
MWDSVLRISKKYDDGSMGVSCPSLPNSGVDLSSSFLKLSCGVNLLR